MCVECHPGLTAHMPPHLRPQPAERLHVVTLGEPAPRAAAQDDIERAIAKARAGCPACHGNAGRCMNGTGAPRFERLDGCAAFTDHGQVKPLTARSAPRQPWEARPARRRAA